MNNKQIRREFMNANIHNAPNIGKWIDINNSTSKIEAIGFQNNDFISINRIHIGLMSKTINGEPICVIDKYDRYTKEDNKRMHIVLIKYILSGKVEVVTFNMIKYCNKCSLTISRPILFDSSHRFHELIRDNTATLGGAEPRYALDRYRIWTDILDILDLNNFGYYITDRNIDDNGYIKTPKDYGIYNFKHFLSMYGKIEYSTGIKPTANSDIWYNTNKLKVMALIRNKFSTIL